MLTPPPEKLGSFYLGAEYDIQKKEILDAPLNYDARDLCTHAVCVGMTGSGKTGLCIGLLEEAAIDKVPALIIDPKGDMTNLLLQFEDMKAEDFLPWINPDDAKRKSKSLEEYAKGTAEMWSKGIASWGQGPERIRALKESIEYTIFTPGSTAGIPINILGSFSAPQNGFEEDPESLRDRIEGIVSALLGMIGSSEDPVRSREGVLLSNIFEHCWRNGEDLDLEKLIVHIQNPPFSKLGAFPVDSFYPEKDRFQLAMSFNSLIASPQFQNWLEGTPLDIDQLYFTPEGKPRHSIICIAHLSDSERMFFVTLLLNSLIGWMRQQSGTTSLRSLLYFDEIFGYFPPTANPPSKKPLLTILKQARAFGVGAVLVTQNPVDIDYKGLSNAGTWFIGKLQTERDKMRLLQALEGAISNNGDNPKTDFDSLISRLDSRVFLMHNVHEDRPVLFHTRWVLSFLRGPMTRTQVKSLMDSRKAAAPPDSERQAKPWNNGTSSSSETLNTAPAILDPGIKQKYYLPLKELQTGSDAVLKAHLLVVGKLRFVDKKSGYDLVENVACLLDAPDEFGRLDWERAFKIDDWNRSISDNAPEINGLSLHYRDVPDTMDTSKKIKALESEIEDHFYHHSKIEVLQNEELDIFQKQGESGEAFMMRVSTSAREKRDEEIDNLRKSYAKKIDAIEDRIMDEQRDLFEAESEAQSRKQDEWMNIAETVFSVLGKRRRRSFSTISTKRRMARRADARVEKIHEDIQDLEMDLNDLRQELETKLDDIRREWIAVESGISTKEIKPRRTDVMIDNISLCWAPA